MKEFTDSVTSMRLQENQMSAAFQLCIGLVQHVNQFNQELINAETTLPIPHIVFWNHPQISCAVKLVAMAQHIEAMMVGITMLCTRKYSARQMSQILKTAPTERCVAYTTLPRASLSLCVYVP